MKLLGIILLAAAIVTVTARHRKEWQKVNPLVGRERFQTFYKSDVPACTRGEGFYRDPQDCHQFIRCVDEFGNGRQFSVFLGRCDPGLVFDENVSACNWPELAAPCSHSPQKLQEVQKPFKQEQVPEDNVVSVGNTWNKPYPVEQQRVVQQPQSSSTYKIQQAETPVVQEIQIAVQEPLYPDKIEQVYIETQTSDEPFQVQEQEQEIESVQTPEIVYQENVQVPEVQQQNFENAQAFEQQAHNEQNIMQSEQQQIILQENIQKDRNKEVVRPEQATSNGFQEVVDQETQQFEIPQQAQQDKFPQEPHSKWWIPETSPQHNPPEVAEQIPVSDVNQEPIFCSQEGFYRHPENCSQFIRCVKIERGAYAVHFFECPTQLIFDEKDSACIVADIHSCRSNTRKKRQASNTKLPCKEEGFFRHPEDCRSFYRCVKTSSGSYETHLFSCPANLVFDEEYTTCNWPDKAPPCESKQQSYKPTRKPVKPAQTERPRSQYKPPSRTTNSGSRSTAKPRNDFMDKSITQETYGKRRSTTERQKYTTQSYEKCRSEGFYRNDNDCTKFFKCVKKGNYFIRYDLSCPANFAYDDRSKRCVTQRYVSSCNKNKPPYPPRQDDEETTTSSFETSSSSSPSSQSGNDNIVCEREGYFRHPEDCNKFYRCVDFEGNGEEFVRYDFNCPEGLVFDEANSVCNWPDQSSPCDTRGGGGQGTGEDGGNETDGNETGDNNGNETEENGDNDEREPESEGNESPTTVQPTTQSVEPTRSSPADENEQEGGSDNESGDSGSENECTKEGFYRNPDDCNKFYRCVDFNGEGKEFVRYDFSCPEGLVFDEVNSVCNWPADSEPCDIRSGEGTGQDGTDTTTSSSPDREEGSSEYSSPNPQTTPSDSGSPESTPGRRPPSESSTDDPRTSTESSNESSNEGPTGSRRGSSGECTEEGFFRNPEDCNKFYRCVDQNGDGKQFVKYDFTCPEGLVFDEVNSVCNWPDQSAPCDGGSPGREQSTTSTTRSESSSSQTSESSQTTASSSRGSSEVTTEGTTASTVSSTTPRSRTSTSSGESSSSTTDRSTTNGENESTSDTSDSGSKGSQGECTEEGFFRNPDDCNKFYRCVDFNGDGQEFVKYDFDCPEGLVFDEVNSVCNWPDQSPKCETRGGSETNGTTDSSSGSTSQTTSSNDQPPSSTERSTESTRQESTERSTQSTNQETTERSTQSTTEQSTSGSTSRDNSECTEPGFFRCKDDCSKFYRCIEENGNLVRYDFKCPDGLIFDDKNKKCDWPSSELSCDTESSGSTTTAAGSTTATAYESSTTESTQASTSSSETSSSDSSRKECTEEGYFRDPDDCSKYYRCIDEGDGTFTREDFSCAEDEVFDEEMRYCNRKDLAPPCDDSGTTSSQSQTTSQTRTTSSEPQSTTTERQTTITTTTTQSSTERSTTPAQSSTESSTKSESTSECTEPGFFRCPEDCTKFYRCVEEDGNRDNLIRYDFHCPDGLIFDERNSKCDWPSSELRCDTDSSTSSTDSQSSTTSTTTTSSTTDSQTSGTTQDTSSSGTTSTSSSTSSEGCTEEGFFQNPEDCSKYYRCIDEGDGTFTREDFACEEDEVFDEEMRYCNRKDLAPPCDGTSSTTVSSVSSTSQSSSEQEPESTSASTSSSSSTTDSSGTTPSSSSTTDSSGSQNSNECTEEGFHRDPNDCSKFYRCVDFQGDGQSFTRYDFDCPDGLVFDETNDVCNWPSSVPSCESSDGSRESTGSSSSTDSNNGSTSETSDSSTSTATPDRSSTTSPTASTEQISSTSSESTSSSVETTSDSSGRSTSSGDRTTTSGSTSSRGSGSSENIECTEEGFFRHPDDCNKFYRCVDFAGTGESFVRYDFDCPEGLVFDEVNSVCNWPTMSPSCESGSRGSNNNNETDNSDSGSNNSTTSSTSGSPPTESSSSGSPTDNSRTSQGDSSTTPRDQTTRSATTTTLSSSGEFQCEEEGYFKHPTDCKKYFECKRDEETGELVKIDCECPDGQVWDNEGWYCNAEELSPPCESSSSFKCREEGFFRDPEDCTRYYQCNRTGPGENDFTSERHQCDDGLVFDENGRYCNAPELSEPCNESSSTSSGTTSEESSGGTTSGGSSRGTPDSGTSTGQGECTREGFFRNPEDCTKYYLCSRNEDTGDFNRTDYSCPDGRIFDEGSNYCNDPQLSEQPCDSDSNGDSTTTRQAGSNSSPPDRSTSSEGTRRNGGDPQCSQEGFFRHPENCSKFYRCVDFSGSGESFVRYDFDCPEGTHFDEVNSVCNWPTMTPRCEPGNGLIV